MEHKKDYTRWTRKEFEALPRADYDNHEVGVITDFIILPKQTMHDSGYRNMEFVVLKRGVPTYIIGDGSDVVLLGGILGVTVGLLKQIGKYDNPDICWNIDCLPVSGLLHIWCNYRLRVGGDYSTMEVFVTNEDVEKEDEQV